MPLIDYIDGANRNIHLHLDSVGVDVEPMEIYKEMRTLRRVNENLRKFDLFLSSHGKDPKGAGKFTERYVKELQGTRIIPYDGSHTLNVTGVIITDDGQEGIACFDKTLLSPTTLVDIDYQPKQVEVIEVATGSALTPEESAMLALIVNILEGDVIPTSAEFRILQKASKAVLVRKTATEVDGLTQLTEPV